MFTISIAQLFPQLSLTPSIPLADSFALIRDPVNYFEKGSDAILQTLVNLNPDINQTLYPALGNARAGKSEPELQVYVVRAKSSLFGYNARQNPPVANFTMSQTSPTVDDTLVQFTDTSTGAPSSWLWDFGDGATSTNQNPQHTFQAFGNLTVSLKVTNDFGFNTIKETVTVQQQIK
jgi:PKD repeat protein